MKDMQKNVDAANEMLAKEHRKKAFKLIDRRAISIFSDKELALWQSEYPAGSPQLILAEHEWQRRLIAAQINAMKFSAYVGIAGVFIGVLLGAFLSYLGFAEKQLSF